MDVPSGFEHLRALVRDVPDFPEPGVTFKDITPLLADPDAFHLVLDRLVEYVAGTRVDVVIGIESRGFLLGAPVADRLGAAFVPARKAGKLPGPTHRVEYDLEYGAASLEIHRDAFASGARVMIVDDVLATGGTAAAAVDLVGLMGGAVVSLAFLIELTALGGAATLGEQGHVALLSY